jgi:hypothetical protein
MGQTHLAMAFPAQPTEPFSLRPKQGRSSPPFAPVSCRRNPAGGGGVAGEQAGEVMDRFGGRREGRSSLEGFSVAEGIGDGEEMAARGSRGHRRGPSGRGGCTWRCDAWGAIETVEGWLEQAVCGGSVWLERNDGGGAEEQPTTPVRRSGELPASVRSSGQ